jgi:hypothetical protein
MLEPIVTASESFNNNPETKIDITAQPIAHATTKTVEITSLHELLMVNGFLADLAIAAPLPKKYTFKSHYTPALIFAITCSVMSSFLYIDGTKNEKAIYMYGGVGSNFPPNVYFDVMTYFFFLTSLQDFQEHRLELLIATLSGIFTTAPASIMDYFLAKNIMNCVFTTIGNLPMNIYGMAAFTRDFNGWRHDNAKLRTTLRLKVFELLNQNYLTQIPYEFNPNLCAEKVMSSLGVMPFGLGLALAQTAYVCASSKGLTNLVGNESARILLATLSSLPAMLIALLVAGKDLGKTAAQQAIIASRYLTGKQQLVLSKLDKICLAGSLIGIAGSIALGYFSSKTSENLNETCPNFGNTMVNLFETYLVMVGARISNSLMCGITTKSFSNYFRQAYASGDYRDQRQLEQIGKFINNGPIKELENIAEKHYPIETVAWKKPSDLKLSQSRLSHFNQAKNKNDYQPLANHDLNEHSKKNICILM